MRVSATVAPAPPGKGEAKAQILPHPNVDLTDVAVLSIQGHNKPGFEGICVVDGGSDRLIVSMGTWGIIITPSKDNQSLRVDVSTMPPISTNGHPLLRGDCQHRGISAAISKDGINATLKHKEEQAPDGS